MTELWIGSLIALWVVVVIAFLLAGTLRQIGLFQLRLGDEPAALITADGLERGVLAPAIRGVDVGDGTEFDSRELSGPPVLVVFLTPTACRADSSCRT